MDLALQKRVAYFWTEGVLFFSSATKKVCPKEGARWLCWILQKHGKRPCRARKLHFVEPKIDNLNGYETIAIWQASRIHLKPRTLPKKKREE